MDLSIAGDGVAENGTTDAEEGGVEGGIRRYAPLIKDIRAHLKAKLPGYSVPTRKLYILLPWALFLRSPFVWTSDHSTSSYAAQPEWEN